MSTTERLAPIDVLKAGGIAVIVGIHAVGGGQLSVLGQYLMELARFAVPTFLGVSGFLYESSRRRSGSRVKARLGRVLAPYLVASILAQLYLLQQGQPRTWQGVLRDLCYGSSFGPYYFVYLLVQMSLLMVLLVRLSRRTVLGLLIVLVGHRAFTSALAIGETGGGDVDLYLVARDPLLWGGYFLSGWTIAAYREPLAAFCARHFRPLLAVGVAASGAILVTSLRVTVPGVSGFAGWANTYVVSAVAALVSTRFRSAPPFVRFLSDASYTFYLYHLFFVLEVHRLLMPSLATEPVAWCAGIAGPWLLVLGSRRLLGARSRTWIGA